MVKNISYFFLLALVAGTFILACANTSSDSSVGAASQSSSSPGQFSVALASAVGNANDNKILAPGVTAQSNEVLGLVVNSNSAKAGLDANKASANSTVLEVWLTNASAYIDENGDAVAKTTGNDYVVDWDAYDPDVAATTSESGVTIAASTTAKDGRMKVTVSDTLLNKTGGAVVVVSIYEPGTATDGSATGVEFATARVARYELTITKAAAVTNPTAAGLVDLGATKLKIIGQHGAADSTPGSAAVGTTAATGGVLAADSGDATKLTTTLTFAGVTAVADGDGVLWDGIGLGGSDASSYLFVGAGAASTARSNGNTSLTAYTASGSTYRVTYADVSAEPGTIKNDTTAIVIKAVDEYGQVSANGVEVSSILLAGV